METFGILKRENRAKPISGGKMQSLIPGVELPGGLHSSCINLGKL